MKRDAHVTYETLRCSVRRIGVYIGSPGLGDFLFIVPLFRALRRGFPDASIAFIGAVRDYVRPLFDACPYIDEIADYDYYRNRSIFPRLSAALRLRRQRFDLLVDTQRKFVPSLLMRLAGARFRAGYTARGFFSQFPVIEVDRDRTHTTEQSLNLVRALGVPDVSPRLECAVPEANKESAECFLAGHGIAPDARIIGLVPSSGIPAKCWPAECFARLADIVAETHNVQILLFGGHDDVDTLERVMALAHAPVRRIEPDRMTVLDTAALMARCAAVVGNDSGPLHLADAVGVPTIGIYGPTLPDKFGLLGARTETLCTREPCSPCDLAACDDIRCLTGITVERVAESLDKIMKRVGHGP